MGAFASFGRLHLCKSLLMTFSKTHHFIRKLSSRNYANRTIFALSSGSTKCAVAVLRVSGPKSSFALQQLCGRLPEKRIASLRKLYHPVSKELLDKSLVIWFPGPQSFTGEDCAEFHVHGGPAVINSVLGALDSIPEMYPAQPGEFTKQAFLNGKLDLTEVEAVGDLIHAETEAQRKQALRQMDGDLSALYSSLRTRLLKCLANAEAFIDFHEEENIEDDILDSVSTEVTLINNDILKHINDSRCGVRLREGLNVVIVGEPNVGKSSLLNSICQRPAAIVSPIAGTTRDVVETALNIAGYPVLLSDTAGLRETHDPVEKEGVNRAVKRVSSSDLKILVVDAVEQANLLSGDIHLLDFYNSYKKELRLFNNIVCDDNNNPSKLIGVEEDLSGIIVVLNKMDLLRSSSISNLQRKHRDHVCSISCLTGEGFDVFMEKLVHKIQNLCGDPLQGSPSLTQTRHKHHLNQCCIHLSKFHKLLSDDVVLAAERLRLAVGEVGQITGAVSAEDVLDVIFRDFCIGK